MGYRKRGMERKIGRGQGDGGSGEKRGLGWTERGVNRGLISTLPPLIP